MINPNDPVPSGCEGVEGFSFSMLSGESGNVINKYDDSVTKGKLALVSRRGDYLIRLFELGLQPCGATFCLANRTLQLALGNWMAGLGSGVTEATTDFFFPLQLFHNGQYLSGGAIADLMVGDVIFVNTFTLGGESQEPGNMSDDAGNTYNQIGPTSSFSREFVDPFGGPSTFIYCVQKVWYAINTYNGPVSLTTDFRYTAGNTGMNILAIVHRIPVIESSLDVISHSGFTVGPVAIDGPSLVLVGFFMIDQLLSSISPSSIKIRWPPGTITSMASGIILESATIVPSYLPGQVEPSDASLVAAVFKIG
jgi:hypothetical protein